MRLICDLPSGSDDEGDLGLSINEEVSGSLGGSLGIDELLVGLGVLSSVLLGGLGSGLSGGGAILLGLLTGSNTGLEELGVSGLLLDDVLWDNSCPKTKHETVMLANSLELGGILQKWREKNSVQGVNQKEQVTYI